MKRTFMNKRPIALPRIGYGTTALGDMPKTYGYGVDERRARETFEAIFAGPPVLLDSSRNYGAGRSEARLGAAIKAQGGLPEGFLLSTKLDRDMASGRFDAAQARRSLEESLEALGLTQIDLLHLHDPEYAASLEEVTGKGGALDALFGMKEEGLVAAVGLAAGRVDLMLPILRDRDFDAIITHNRFTLLNRNAEAMIAEAAARGIAVVNAAPYASGLLARGSYSGATYVYQEPDEALLARLRLIEAICAEYGVPPGAAALQFSLREPRIATTLCGVSQPENVIQTQAWAEAALPQTLWQALSALPADQGDPEATRHYQPD